MSVQETLSQLQDVICDIDSAQSSVFDPRDANVRFNEIRVNCALAHALLDELDRLLLAGALA